MPMVFLLQEWWSFRDCSKKPNQTKPNKAKTITGEGGKSNTTKVKLILLHEHLTLNLN